MTCEMRVMGPEGDTKTIWDPDDPTQVDVARESFNTLRRQGYLAYRVSEGGKKAEAMGDFDPRAGKVILSPPMAGG